MSDLKDFKIENGALTKYTGKGGDVVIPEGVIVIEKKAFSGHGKITSITIPKSVTNIETSALTFGSLNLKTYKLNTSLTKIIVVEDNPSYKSMDGNLYSKDGKTLIRYMMGKKDTAFVVPDTVTHIADSAFAFCNYLTSVTIPEGVMSIGDEAFFDCRGLTTIEIPESVTEFGEGIFSDCYPLKKIVCNSRIAKLGKQNIGSLFDVIVEFPNLTLTTKEKLSALAAAKAIIKTAKEYAYVWCYQSGKSWEGLLNSASMDSNEVVQALGNIILNENKIAAPLWKKILTYMELNVHALTQTIVKEFLEILAKKDKKAEKVFLEADVIKKVLAKESAESKHPIETLVEKHLVVSSEYSVAIKEIKKGINYLDSDQVCDVKVLAFIVSEYMRLHDSRSTQYVSEYKNACMPYKLVPMADEIAAALDKNQLQELLMTLAFEKGGAFILPFARYADEKHAAMLVTQMSKWENWGSYAATGRKNIIIARSGLLLSDTKAAMLHMDKVGQLEKYAKMRNTDVDTLRDTVLSDFGFDDKGKIYYDLKGTMVSIYIGRDLKLYLFDENTGKEIKALPKKNVDLAVYDVVKTEISNLKKNVKKVVVNCKNHLFEKFLNGKQQESKSWKEVYLKNPVFTAFARLVVWSQEGNSFILTDNGAIECNGNEYTITESPIAVAHPVEMTREEVVAWQTYFLSKGLKQPFEQVWEPAYNSADIQANRYDGCVISAYKLLSKEAHGIFTYGMENYSEEYGFTLTDCKMQYIAEIEGGNYFVYGVEANVTLGVFSFDKLTRYVNHIVCLFDKWTIMEKIAKDDVSIVNALDGFTGAQICEFIEFATANECVNVTALLLNYKNEHFGDTMDEFILEL